MFSVVFFLLLLLLLILVIVVMGFFGVGKIILLCGLVQCCQLCCLVLFINEFGEVVIDGDLLCVEGDVQGYVQIQDFVYGFIVYGDDEYFVFVMLVLVVWWVQIDYVFIEMFGLVLFSVVMEVL